MVNPDAIYRLAAADHQHVKETVDTLLEDGDDSAQQCDDSEDEEDD